MKHIRVGILAIIGTLLTVVIPVEVDSIKEYSHVELGFPLYFVVQDKNIQYDPPEAYFPAKVNFGSPWEDVPSIIFFSWRGFVIDVIVWFLALQLLLGIANYSLFDTSRND